MKRLLIAKDLAGLFEEPGSFLERGDIRVKACQSHDELLAEHRVRPADIIVTQLDLPGMRTEAFFAELRNTPDLRTVSTIIVCTDTLANRARCRQCGPNAVFTLPVDRSLLLVKVQQLIQIAPRMSYRTALAVAIQGSFKNRPLPFRTENISANGMLMRAAEPLAQGDPLFFSFFLPNGTHVTGYGEITRIVQLATEQEDYYYGVKFTNIAPADREAIDEAVGR